ncbi:MAG: FAD-dependent oxidoreductase [Myxococcota bacterium]|nr:FAD-dependent oxidoreductase [Myxococcota bacterium]
MTPEAVGPVSPERKPPAQRGGEHAIVIGAGLAGLLAARVLADRFRAVTVVERDPSESASARPSRPTRPRERWRRWAASVRPRPAGPGGGPRRRRPAWQSRRGRTRAGAGSVS